MLPEAHGASADPERTLVKLDAAALARFERHRYISLATFRRGGDVVKTPVWSAEHGGRFYVFTAAGSGKVKRLQNDPRIRLRRRTNPRLGFALLAGESCGFACGVAQTRYSGLRS